VLSHLARSCSLGLSRGARAKRIASEACVDRSEREGGKDTHEIVVPMEMEADTAAGSEHGCNEGSVSYEHAQGTRRVETAL
jgi:hypothetical protein